MNKTKKIKYCQLPETYNINGSSVHLYHIPNNTLHVSAMVIGGKFKETKKNSGIIKAAREKLADGWIKIILKGLDELLERGGDYFADNRLTVADLKVVAITESLISGQFEHIPADIVERVAPRLVAHAERVSQDPIVTAYYAARTQ